MTFLSGTRPRVVIVATGGTIAGTAARASESTTYQAGALGADALIAAVPELTELAHIQAESFAAIDSKDASLAFWCGLSKRVNALLARDDVDAVVITHGTDTLEETAYWLHLTVRSDKPVVMTAAMRPATALSADGPGNLYDAVSVAATPQARGRGVLFVFGNRIHSARSVVKASSHAPAAFLSPDEGGLGWAQDGRVTFDRVGHRLHTHDSVFATVEGWAPEALANVAIVVSYAGADRRIVDALRQTGVNGIVVAGTGNGSIHADLLQGLVDAAAAGVAVVRSSRTGDVRVREGAAHDDATFGFIASGSLNPYKARVLLLLALSAGGVDKAPVLPALRALFERY